jgi:purine catabolism regulator
VSHYNDLPFDKRNIIRETVLGAQREIWNTQSLRSFAISFNDSFIFFLFYQNSVTQEEAQLSAFEAAQRLQAVLGRCHVECCIGMSGYCNDIMQIHTAFRQTIDIINIGKKVKPKESIYTYGQLYIYHMLHTSMNEHELKQLYEETILPLDEFDKKNNCSYLLTLEAYLNTRFNASRAAANLHVHRNTMLYQLDKIRSILSVDFGDNEQVLRLQLGIHARKIFCRGA